MPTSAHRSLVKPLEPSSWAAAFVGPKARMPAACKVVDEARHQGRLGTDHHEADALARTEGPDRGMVGHVEVGPVLAEGGRARIARRGEQAGAERALGDGVGEGVLAPARADEEDVHGR